MYSTKNYKIVIIRLKLSVRNTRVQLMRRNIYILMRVNRKLSTLELEKMYEKQLGELIHIFTVKWLKQAWPNEHSGCAKSITSIIKSSSSNH